MVRTFRHAVEKALLAVIPANVPVLAVGGVDAGNLAAWWAAGARGFGVGSALYRPGAHLGAVLRC